MRVCDRCGERHYTTIKIDFESQEFDLCQVHFQEVMDLIKKRELEAPPKKESTEDFHWSV